MTSEANRHTFVRLALGFLPPRVRNSLLDSEEFVEQWGLETIAGVTLGKDGPSFQRDRLYDGIREAIRAAGKEAAIEDDQSVTWRIRVQEKDEGLLFYLENQERSLSIPDHSGLAEDQRIRMKWFAEATHEVNLEETVLEDWKARVENGALSDDEFVKLNGELELTPINNYRNIHNSLLQGSVDIGTLIPSERRYYDRLAGPVGSAVDAESYISSEAVRLIDNWQQWDPIRGFLMSLLICTKSNVSKSIRIDQFSEEELLLTYEWIEKQGDPVSQIGAVEVALRNINKNRVLEPFI